MVKTIKVEVNAEAAKDKKVIMEFFKNLGYLPAGGCWTQDATTHFVIFRERVRNKVSHENPYANAPQE
jgi:hypothetical protein